MMLRPKADAFFTAMNGEPRRNARQNKPDFVGQSNIDLEWKVKENLLLKSKIRTFLSANA